MIMASTKLKIAAAETGISKTRIRFTTVGRLERKESSADGSLEDAPDGSRLEEVLDDEPECVPV